MAKRRKRTFSKEFKEEAVRLVQSGKRSGSEVAASLDISPSLLCKWVRASTEEGPEAFRGHGNSSATEEELNQLRSRVRTLEQELTFLKKVSRYFAKDQT
jgi:transposase